MCDVCNGHSGCPVCSKEPVYIDCPECNGVGYFYYTEDGDRLSEEVFYGSSYLSGITKERCDVCDGEGQIIYEDGR